MKKKHFNHNFSIQSIIILLFFFLRAGASVNFGVAHIFYMVDKFLEKIKDTPKKIDYYRYTKVG